MTTGPFVTQAQAAALPEVRAIYDAFKWHPATGDMAPLNYQLLSEPSLQPGSSSAPTTYRYCRTSPAGGRWSAR
jgi:hypothetical protein